MNPLSGQSLASRLSSARRSDGVLPKRYRDRREQWRAASAAQDAPGLKELGRRVSLTEHWELVAGCASVWAWNEVVSWGREPSIAAFDGFADALNTADSPEHRASLWAVWPLMMDCACSQPESWLKYVMHSLSQVEVWAQGEAEQLDLARLLPNQDWQAPFNVWDLSVSSAFLTPLQYAWQKGNPGLCRMFLEGGADGHALSPESWWPGWSLVRAFEGKCLGDEPQLMAGPDEESVRALVGMGSVFAHSLRRPDLVELVDYQRLLTRCQSLDKDLPPAAPERKGPRF